MIEQQQQEIELDVFFEGTKDQLFAVLFPITGVNSPIFNHLEMNQIDYDKQAKQLQFTYETKDFKNIDRQKEPVKYASTSLPSKSNYFYSYHTPQGLVWRNISKILQMRPKIKNSGQQLKQVQEKNIRKQGEMVEEGMEIEVEPNTVELYRIGAEDQDNKIMNQILSTPQRYYRNEENIARKNWDMNQRQYFLRLFG